MRFIRFALTRSWSSFNHKEEGIYEGMVLIYGFQGKVHSVLWFHVVPEIMGQSGCDNAGNETFLCALSLTLMHRIYYFAKFFLQN